MSKKQVLLLSIMTAIPSVILLTVLVLNGLEHGGKMFSGMMTVFVAVTGLLALFGVGMSPFAVMAFYPAEGFASQGGMIVPGTGAASPRPSIDDDGDGEEFEDDGFDEEMSGEDSYDDDGEELFDDGDLEDEDEEW